MPANGFQLSYGRLSFFLQRFLDQLLADLSLERDGGALRSDLQTVEELDQWFQLLQSLGLQRHDPLGKVQSVADFFRNFLGTIGIVRSHDEARLDIVAD